MNVATNIRRKGNNNSFALPQLKADLFITDGGLETTLGFHEELDLPYFAAFPLIESSAGRAALLRYYAPYLDLAERLDVGIILDTATWRANLDWAAKLGFDVDRLTAVNYGSVALVRELADARPGLVAVINGVIGPRGDGYVYGDAMSTQEATAYHAIQARAFAAAGADMVTAVTMTYAEEAIGIVTAVAAVELPVVVSFTVATDGRLPSGEPIADAIARVDAATGHEAAYFMINCAHPSHFDHIMQPEDAWLERVKGIRANASCLSHAELDAATELDRGDIDELAAHYEALCRSLPDLRVVGGCCGTDHEHIAAIAARLVSS